MTGIDYQKLTRRARALAIHIVTTFLGFVIFKPELFGHYPLIVNIANYAAFGGLTAFGVKGVVHVYQKESEQKPQKKEVRHGKES